MTPLTGKDLEKRLDHPLFGDAYLTGVAATAGVFGLAGWGAGWGLLLGLALGLPAVFVVAITVGLLSGDNPLSLRGPLLGSAAYAGAVASIGHTYAGTPGLWVGAAVFVYLAAQVTRRHRALPKDAVAIPDKPAPPALAGEPAPEPNTPTQRPHALSGPVVEAVAELPPDLSVDLRARVDAAVEDYRQLHEILLDDRLLTHVAVDAPGMLSAAEEVALDLLRDVPRLARIQTLAARRPDDPDARAASDAALAALDKQADALHQAVSAAFRILATTAASDPDELREHTAQLHALRAAHDELHPGA